MGQCTRFIQYLYPTFSKGVTATTLPGSMCFSNSSIAYHDRVPGPLLEAPHLLERCVRFSTVQWEHATAEGEFDVRFCCGDEKYAGISWGVRMGSTTARWRNSSWRLEDSRWPNSKIRNSQESDIPFLDVSLDHIFDTNGRTNLWETLDTSPDTMLKFSFRTI